MNFMKRVCGWVARQKAIVCCGLMGVASAVMAEETVTKTVVDVESEIGDIKQGLLDVISQLKAPVVAVVLAGLALWIVPRIPGFLTKAFNAIKGR